MKLNFSYRTELFRIELFQFSFRTVNTGSVFFDSIQFLVFLPTSTNEVKVESKKAKNRNY